MKYLSTAVTMTVLGLALSRQAQAVNLYTSPVAGDAVNNTLYCDAVNTRSKPLTITIEAYDQYGDLRASLSNSVMQPGQGVSLPSTIGGYCKFKVSGPKSSVAAMALYSSNVNGTYTTVEVAR